MVIVRRVAKDKVEVAVFRIVLFSFHLFFLDLKECNFLILALGWWDSTC